MSIKIQSEVWKYSKASGNDLLVLLAIADNAGEDDREAFPKVQTIADKCRLGKRAVQYCVNRLIELGEMQVTPVFTHDGRQRRNTYKISEMEGAQIAPPQPGMHETSPPSVHPDAPPRVHGGACLINHHIEPPYEPPLSILAPPIALAADNKDIVQSVFSYWQEKTKHPGAILDAKRKSVLTRAMSLGYTADQLRSAVDGCLKSLWHQGDNPDGKIYDAITLIFRDAEHIEKFIGYKKSPPKAYVKTPIINGVRVPPEMYDEQTGWISPEFGRSPDQIG